MVLINKQGTGSVRTTRTKYSSLDLGRLALSSCYLFQALADEHFTKGEISPTILGRRTQGDHSATCGIFSLLGDDFSPFRSAAGTRLATASLSIGRRGELGLYVV
jgi:hypothetical protein